MILLCNLWAAVLFAGAANALDPDGIIVKMESAMRGESSYTEMVMRIERPRYSRELSMRCWLKGLDYSLVIITSPARDEGMAYLMRNDEIWNYDPRIDRITRLPPSMMFQSWMNSDFTNDDIVRDTDLLRDYDKRLLGREPCEEKKCFVIEMVPKPNTPIVWGKVKMWISEDDFLQRRVENYDQRGALVSTMTMDRIMRFDGRYIPSRITLIPAGKEGERTILTYTKATFDIGVGSDFFSFVNMQRLR